MEDFENQIKMFDLYYSVYSEGVRFLLFTCFVSEQFLDENDIWETLVLVLVCGIDLREEKMVTGMANIPVWLDQKKGILFF